MAAAPHRLATVNPAANAEQKIVALYQHEPFALWLRFAG